MKEPPAGSTGTTGLGGFVSFLGGAGAGGGGGRRRGAAAAGGDQGTVGWTGTGAVGSGGGSMNEGGATGSAWVTSRENPSVSLRPDGISSRTSSSTDRKRTPIPDWLRRASSGCILRAWATTPSTVNPRSRSITSTRIRDPDGTGLLVAMNIPVSEIFVV